MTKPIEFAVNRFRASSGSFPIARRPKRVFAEFQAFVDPSDGGEQQAPMEPLRSSAASSTVDAADAGRRAGDLHVPRRLVGTPEEARRAAPLLVPVAARRGRLRKCRYHARVENLR